MYIIYIYNIHAQSFIGLSFQSDAIHEFLRFSYIFNLWNFIWMIPKWNSLLYIQRNICMSQIIWLWIIWYKNWICIFTRSSEWIFNPRAILVYNMVTGQLAQGQFARGQFARGQFAQKIELNFFKYQPNLTYTNLT